MEYIYKISKMTEEVATDCGQIGKDITIWLCKLWRHQMESKGNKNRKMTRLPQIVASLCGQIEKDITIWLQAGAPTNVG